MVRRSTQRATKNFKIVRDLITPQLYSPVYGGRRGVSRARNLFSLSLSLSPLSLSRPSLSLPNPDPNAINGKTLGYNFRTAGYEGFSGRTPR